MVQTTNTCFSDLNSREILDFLIGDHIIQDLQLSAILAPSSNNEYQTIPTFQLPYLTGNKILNLYCHFGLSCPEYKDGNPSRWMMMQHLLSTLDKLGRTNELLDFLFSKSRFQNLINHFRTVSDFETYYQGIIKLGTDYINKQLYLTENKVVVSNCHFYVQKKCESNIIPIEKIDTITSQYIQALPERIKSDLIDKNYDSVINKCRTLVEEVLCYIIECKGCIPVESGDINQLQGQCRSILNMKADKGQDQRILQLLKGLSSIINAIASLRNIGSDAHGVGSKRINIGEREAVLISNATQTYCDYFLSVFLSQENK